MTAGTTAGERELFDPDAPVSVRAGRRFPYTTIGDWLLLCPDVTDREFRIYCLLRMHANQRKGDRCWPTHPTLAALLGIAKTDTIPPAIRHLVELGAVDVETVATTKGRQNVYTVHEAPPEGWEGPVFPVRGAQPLSGAPMKP